MTDVFLSYRRDDSRSATGRLKDRLETAFGADRVFRDVDSIGSGADFQAALERAIGSASVVLAIVGVRWVDARDAAGRRRLEDPQDMVRRELEAALAAGVPIIPVLVEGARMPAAEALPSSLAAFARCQAITLDDEGWRDDTQRLVALLREHHGVEPGDPADGTMVTRGWSLAALPLELVELAVTPRRLIVRLAGVAGRRELQRGAGLLLLGLVLGNVLIGAALGIELVSWVLNGVLLGLLGSAMLSAAVGIGWRTAGVRAGWQRVTIGAVCVITGTWLYISAGMLLITLGYAMVDLGTFKQTIDLVRRGSMTQAELLSIAQGLAHGPVLAATVLATVVWLAGLAWIVRAWSALRLACSAGRLRSLMAAAITLSLVASVIYAAHWAATA